MGWVWPCVWVPGTRHGLKSSLQSGCAPPLRHPPRALPCSLHTLAVTSCSPFSKAPTNLDSACSLPSCQRASLSQRPTSQVPAPTPPQPQDPRVPCPGWPRPLTWGPSGPRYPFAPLTPGGEMSLFWKGTGPCHHRQPPPPDHLLPVRPRPLRWVPSPNPPRRALAAQTAHGHLSAHPPSSSSPSR